MSNDLDNDVIRRIDGPTPSGGAYAILYFYDENDNPTIESKATKAYGVEFNKKGERIKETYFNLSTKDVVSDEIKDSIEDTIEFPRIR